MVKDMTAAAPLALDRAVFHYEPYPIGLISNVFEASYYDELLKTFPPLELFRFMQYHGDKYSLSEVNHPDKYLAFLAATPPWRRLYDYVKGERFIPDVVALLTRHHVDLNIPSHALGRPGRSVKQRLRRSLLSLLGVREKALSARFEFSAMPLQGGNILPHTDSPQKIITLVLSMRERAGWDEANGGSTEVMRPRDPAKSFNLANKYLTFDEVETVRHMPFDPNQCVIFIKTFNSLHAVRPMSGPAGMFRRTLTINIEVDSAW
jgi:hypothetical protein